jgi:hypothetical protein
MGYPKGKPRLDRRINSDPDLHKKYIPFLRARAQAWYRGEEFEMTFEEYVSIWSEAAWSLRGRSRNSICMTRKDILGSWSLANCELVTRLEMLRRNENWKHRVH